MPGTGNSGGNRAKSLEALELAGTKRRDRHEGFTQPEPPKDAPRPPCRLSGEVRMEWNRMIERLELSGTLSRVDGASLYAYCCLWADTEKLQQAVDALPEPFFDKVSVVAGVEHREPKVHPGFAQLRGHRQALRGYLVEFGLTPASRNRVKLPMAREQGDDLDSFIDTNIRRVK